MKLKVIFHTPEKMDSPSTVMNLFAKMEFEMSALNGFAEALMAIQFDDWNMEMVLEAFCSHQSAKTSSNSM